MLTTTFDGHAVPLGPHAGHAPPFGLDDRAWADPHTRESARQFLHATFPDLHHHVVTSPHEGQSPIDHSLDAAFRDVQTDGLPERDRKILRLALIFHDVGKSLEHGPDAGLRHIHPWRSEVDAMPYMGMNWGLDPDAIRDTLHLIKYHDVFHDSFEGKIDRYGKPFYTLAHARDVVRDQRMADLFRRVWLSDTLAIPGFRDSTRVEAGRAEEALDGHLAVLSVGLPRGDVRPDKAKHAPAPITSHFHPLFSTVDLDAVWAEHSVVQDMLLKVIAQPPTPTLLAAQVELEQQSAWLMEAVAAMKTTAVTHLNRTAEGLRMPWTPRIIDAADDASVPIDSGHWVTIGGNHVYIDGAGGSGSVLTDGQLGVADSVIRELAASPVEHIRVYDRDGKLLFARSGDATKIQLSDAEMDVLKSDGTWAIHNHPEALKFPPGDPRREVGNSFSPDDIDMAIVGNMAETQVIAGNTLYTMRPGKRGWNAESVIATRAVIDRERLAVQTRYQSEIDARVRSHANGVAHLWDTIWHNVARQMGWHYSHTTVSGVDDKGRLVFADEQVWLTLDNIKTMWASMRQKYDPTEARDEHGRWASDGMQPGADDELFKRTDSVLRGGRPLTFERSRFMSQEDERAVNLEARQALVTRLLGSERARQAWNRSFVGPDKYWSDPLEAMPERAQREAMRDTFLEDMRAWNRSSTGFHSLSMQQAAVDEFGLDRQGLDGVRQRAIDANHVGPGVLRSADEEYAKSGDWYRAELRALYDETQAKLKAAGLDKVAIARGLRWDSKDEVPAQVIEALPGMLNNKGVIDAHAQPISSWTAFPDVANDFAQTKYSVVLRATVPASRILAMPSTGMGTMVEHELLVLDSPGSVGIEFARYTAWENDASFELTHATKANPYHDDLGRFTTGPGDDVSTSLTAPPALSTEDMLKVAKAENDIRTALPQHVGVSLAGVDAQTATELAHQMRIVNETWPDLAKNLTFFGIPDAEFDTHDARAGVLPGWWHAQFPPDEMTTAAETRSAIPEPEPTSGGVQSSLVFNPRWFDNREAMQQEMVESERNRWRFQGSASVGATLTHEMGHVMAKYLKYRSEASRARYDAFVGRFGPSMWSTVSRYAQTDAEEAFAEAFGALHYQPQVKWAPFTREVAMYLNGEHVFQPKTKTFDPDEPRDEYGRWTSVAPDLLNQYSDWRSLFGSASRAEQMAMGNYSLLGYKSLNERLRGKRPWHTDENGWDAETRDALDAMMAKHSLPEDITVYRLMAYHPSWVGGGKVGAVYTDLGFVSTSTMLPVLGLPQDMSGRTMVARINVPKGTRALWLGHRYEHNRDEHELLLNRGLYFKITGVRQIGRTTEYSMDVVPKP